MSDYVVHFTKPVPVDDISRPRPKDPDKPRWFETAAQLLYEQRVADRTGYYPWIDILGSGLLQPGSKPLGAARFVPEVEDLNQVVCFSEIPLDMLDRVIERRSLYGVGFRKDVIVAKGGSPLWYLDKDGMQGQLIQAQIREAQRSGVDRDDPLWKLTPFIDNPGNYKGVPYRFEWEREWRVVGDVRFEPDEVAFLFLPEEDHDRARQFFADAKHEHAGPSYLGTYIDPRWDMQRIQEALASVPPVPDPSPGSVPWWAE